MPAPKKARPSFPLRSQELGGAVRGDFRLSALMTLRPILRSPAIALCAVLCLSVAPRAVSAYIGKPWHPAPHVVAVFAAVALVAAACSVIEWIDRLRERWIESRRPPRYL